MRILMNCWVEFEVGTPRPNDARVRDAIVQRFKGNGATDLDLGVIVRAYTNEHTNTPLHLRAIRLPNGAERAPTSFIRIQE